MSPPYALYFWYPLSSLISLVPHKQKMSTVSFVKWLQKGIRHEWKWFILRQIFIYFLIAQNIYLSWLIEYLWCLEAWVWSGKWDGWGCLFGVELAVRWRGGSGSGVCLTRCVLVSIQKLTPTGTAPSFPPDRLSSAQELDTDTSSRLRHIIWACQGLYQTGSTGALSLSP